MLHPGSRICLTSSFYSNSILRKSKFHILPTLAVSLRRIHSEACHKPVCQIILHAGAVLNQVIKAQLIQSIVAFGTVILVKFDLEAISVAVH